MPSHKENIQTPRKRKPTPLKRNKKKKNQKKT
jgi:hypothetical protein